MAEETMSLTIFDPIRATLAALEKKDQSLVFDHTAPEGEAELRSWVKNLRGFKGDVARAHKDTKANALNFGRQVDAIKNELTAGADKIITERMKPLDEIEAKKRAKAEAIIEAERLKKEKAEQERLADLERREAEAARKEDEIRKKEQAEREKQIADEAAENARKETEAKAEREKQEAVEAEKEKARKLEVERVKKLQAEQDEKERLATLERERVANEEHRDEVENKAVEAFDAAFGIDFNSEAVVTVIKEGRIPNVTINY